MLLVIGLGNIGDEYKLTYHNVGFLAVDVLADRFNIKINKKECHSLVGVGSVYGEKIVLAKPQTYMNNSGIAALQLMKKYGQADTVIVYDDIDLEKGVYRYRESGSAGTHNGMRSIITESGSANIRRIRIGIGPVPIGIPLATYVLQDMTDGDRALIAKGVKDGVEKILNL